MKRIAPLLWGLFSAGGTVAAFLFPVHLFLLGLAFPLGWLAPPDPARGFNLVAHPWARLYFFIFISLPLFHWAHRFRYTLYAGLQIKPLPPLIIPFCYGGALLGTIAAARVLLNFH